MGAPKSIRELFCCIVLTCCLAFGGIAAASAQSTAPLSKGQVIYVPVYSHIYIGDRERPFLLAVTLSIRNTDRNNPITVQKAVYYDSNGRRLEDYLKAPKKLEQLSAVRFVVHESDVAGGSGASFIVEWTSDKAVSPPIIESVMIGTQTQQGISFTSRGQVVEEK
ncbi:MAG: DUF3124 domain-containing protein [Desulfobacteraceae bacterium]|nr:DUF3124 domain-containing protein [Desulfobacteraceae bacterium]